MLDTYDFGIGPIFINAAAPSTAIAEKVQSTTLIDTEAPGGLFDAVGRNYYNYDSSLLVGSVVLYSGAVVNYIGATVGNGGTLYAGNGGTIDALTVDGNSYIGTPSYTGSGFLVVLSGGLVSAATVNGVASVTGGVFEAATIEDGGFLVVSSGGTISTTIVASGGSAFLKSGSNIASLAVSNGGTLEFGGATVGKGTVASAGILGALTRVGNVTISPGGTVNYSAVTVDGELDVDSGGVAFQPVVSSGGFLAISGGVVSEATVDSGGVAVLYNGGTADGMAISSGGALLFTNLVVPSGFTASASVLGTTSTLDGVTLLSGAILGFENITVLNGGTLFVDHGAIATNVTVSSGGLASGGGTLSGTVIDAGAVDSVTIASGILITSGGTGSSIVVLSGATETVLGGTTSARVSGSEIIFSGAVASGTTLLAGSQTIQSGGVASGTVISGAAGFGFGGKSGQYISQGGVAIDDTVRTNGRVYVSGGVDSGALIQSSGIEYVFVGGVSLSAIVGGNGELIVSSGGIASNTALGGPNDPGNEFNDTGGEEMVFTGGTAVSVTVNSGGGLYTQTGGTTSDTLVHAGGNDIIAGGTAINAQVLSGGGQVAAEGGAASGTIVSAGGTELLYGDGSTLTNVEILAGATLDLYQFTVAATSISSFVATAPTAVSGATLASGAVLEYQNLDLRNGGTLMIASGRVGTNIAVEQGATVEGAGLLVGATDFGLISGVTLVGNVEVYAGGVLSDVAAPDAGIELQGGSAFGLTLDSSTISEQGGTNSGAMLSDHASDYIYAGGTAFGTQLLDSEQFVEPFGIASGTVVESGSVLQVANGGTANGAVVMSGGLFDPLSGSTITSTTFASGSTLQLTARAPGSAINLAGNRLELLASTTSGSLSGLGTILTGVGQLVVDSGATWSLSGSNSLAAGAAILNAGNLSVVDGGLNLQGTFFNNGSLLIDPSQVVVGSLTGSGTTTVAADSSLDVQGAVGADQTITFAGAGAELILDDPLAFSGTIDALTSAGSIQLTGFDPTAGLIPSTGFQNGTLTVTNGDGSETASFITKDIALTALFTATDDGTGNVVVTDDVPCYCRGTRILTVRGEVAVEELAIGDYVVTASGEVRPIKWLGRRSYAGWLIADNPNMLPVCFKEGALGDGIPARDLWVSPDHAMFLDGCLIPAGLLVNHASIFRAARVEEVHYIHVELPTHDILLAEGAPSESFVDDDSRLLFHNAADYFERYSGAAHAPALYCAPRVTEGYALERIRQRLGERAGIRAPVRAVPLRGYVDHVGAGRVEGWAQNPEHREAPVCLDVVVDGKVMMQTLADRYRHDLERAGIGSGRHSFAVALPVGLTAAQIASLVVRRSMDGAELPRSATARQAA